MEEDIVRISELPGANPLAGPELVPLVQDGVTKTRSAVDIVLDGGLQEHLDASDPHSQYAFRVKNNLEATTDPTVNDDINEGYTPTSRWVNTATEEFFICVTNTAGNANWQTLTLTLDELGSAALADTGAGNGLDADLLDAQQGTYYLDFPNFTNLPDPVLTLTGDVSGSATFTNLGDATLSVAVDDDSHNHIISNVDGLQGALDDKVDKVTGKGLSTEDYTTAEKSKLSGIESGATADQTASEIKTAYESNANTNAFTDADENKLDGIEAGAEVNTVDSINSKTGTVVLVTDDISEDGSPINLWFTNSRARGAISASGDVSYNPTTGVISYSETYSTPSELLTAIKTVDGSGSGLDADLLDNQSSTFYRNASNLNAGTISDDLLPLNISSNILGNSATTTKLATARTITLGGDLSGSANFDGSANISINASVADDSHNHIISNVDGLQTALNGKLDNGAKAADSNLLDGVNSTQFVRSDVNDIINGNLSFVGALNNTAPLNFDGSSPEVGIRFWETSSANMGIGYNGTGSGSGNYLYIEGISGNEDFKFYSEGELEATSFTGNGSGLTNIDALNINYDNTTSGLVATDVKSAIDEVASSSSVPANLEVADYVRHTGDTDTGLFFPASNAIELRAANRRVFQTNGTTTNVGGPSTLQLGNFSGAIFRPIWFISQSSTSIQKTTVNLNRVGSFMGYTGPSSRLEAYSVANVGSNNFFYAGIGFESTYGNDGTASLVAESGAGSDVLAITRLENSQSYISRWTMRQDADSDDWEFRGNVTIPDGQIGSNATRDVLIQTSEPTSGQGNDGDVCYVYTP